MAEGRGGRSSGKPRKEVFGKPDISARGMLTSPNVEETLMLRLAKTGMTDEEFKEFWQETKKRRAQLRRLTNNTAVAAYTTEYTTIKREINRNNPPKYFACKIPDWRLAPIKRPDWDDRFCWTPYCDEFGAYRGTG